MVLAGGLLTFLLPTVGHAHEGLFALEQGAGNTSRAHLASLSTPLTAPATLALAPRYDIALGAGLGPDKSRRINGAAIDSTTGPIALGLIGELYRSSATAKGDNLPGWKLPDDDLENTVQGLVVGGALASSWLNRAIGLGVGGVYRSEGSQYQDQSSDFNANASVAAQFNYKGSISITAENLIPTDFAGAPLQLGFGSRWQPDPNGGLSFDVILPLEGKDKLIYQVGGDYAFAGMVPVRVGYARDLNEQTDMITTGLSVGELPGILDYSLQILVKEAGSSNSSWSAWHALTLRMRF